MTANTKKIKYVPGTHAKKRPKAAQLIDQYIRDWNFLMNAIQAGHQSWLRCFLAKNHLL